MGIGWHNVRLEEGTHARLFKLRSGRGEPPSMPACRDNCTCQVSTSHTEPNGCRGRGWFLLEKEGVPAVQETGHGAGSGQRGRPPASRHSLGAGRGQGSS